MVLLFVPSSRKVRFACTISILNLSNVPYVSGLYSAKWNLSNRGSKGNTKEENVRENTVIWNENFHIDKITFVLSKQEEKLKPLFLNITIRQSNHNSKKEETLGTTSIDLAALAETLISNHTRSTDSDHEQIESPESGLSDSNNQSNVSPESSTIYPADTSSVYDSDMSEINKSNNSNSSTIKRDIFSKIRRNRVATTSSKMSTTTNTTNENMEYKNGSFMRKVLLQDSKINASLRIQIEFEPYSKNSVNDTVSTNSIISQVSEYNQDTTNSSDFRKVNSMLPSSSMASIQNFANVASNHKSIDDIFIKDGGSNYNHSKDVSFNQFASNDKISDNIKISPSLFMEIENTPARKDLLSSVNSEQPNLGNSTLSAGRPSFTVSFHGSPEKKGEVTKFNDPLGLVDRHALMANKSRRSSLDTSIEVSQSLDSLDIDARPFIKDNTLKKGNDAISNSQLNDMNLDVNQRSSQYSLNSPSDLYPARNSTTNHTEKALHRVGSTLSFALELNRKSTTNLSISNDNQKIDTSLMPLLNKNIKESLEPDLSVGRVSTASRNNIFTTSFEALHEATVNGSFKIYVDELYNGRPSLVQRINEQFEAISPEITFVDEQIDKIKSEMDIHNKAIIDKIFEKSAYEILASSVKAV